VKERGQKKQDRDAAEKSENNEDSADAAVTVH
jgi:hypothetical protein